MILVSACLAGEKCKYSGGDNLHPEIARLVKEGRAVMVCPEQLGGLPTPRCPRLPACKDGDLRCKESSCR